MTNILPPRTRKSRRVLSMIGSVPSELDARIVRLMTRQTRLAARVVLDVDGRITLRLAGVRGVTVNAEGCRDGSRRLRLVGPGRMPRQRAVTRLARDALVPGLRAQVDDVGMTLRARGLPRVRERPRPHI